MSIPTPRPEYFGLDATLRDFETGQLLFSRYQLVKILGRGGTGIVWLAFDLRLEREIALKFLPDTVTFNPEARKTSSGKRGAACSSRIPISSAFMT